MRAVLAGLLIALLPVASAYAQRGEEPACRACGGSGLSPCKDRVHKGIDPAWEDGFHCADAARCEDCAGTLYRLCRRCGGTEELASVLEERRAAQKRFLADFLASREEVMQRRLHAVSGGGMDVVVDLPRYSYQDRRRKVPIRAHGAAHLYHQRALDLRRDFLAWMQAQPSELSAPVEVYLWDVEEDQLLASEQFLKMKSKTAVKLLGATPRMSMYYDRSNLHEEFEFHRAVVHNLTHCLLSNVFVGKWPGFKHGWLDAGVAHAFEFRYWDQAASYCYTERDLSSIHFDKTDWRKKLRIGARRGELPSLAGLCRLLTDNIEPDQHPAVWSLTEYLHERCGESWPRLVRSAKDGEDFGRIVRAILETDVPALQEDWRRWILETYDR